MRNRGVLIALLFFAFAATGCSDDAVLLLVSLKTDFVPAVEFSEVRTVLVDGLDERSQVFDVSADSDYLAGVRVGEFGDVTPGAVTMRVELLGARRAVIAQRLVRVDYDGSLGVTVIITRDCEGVSCDPTVGFTCVGGGCVDPGCTEETPELCGDPSCATAAECPTGQACAVPACVAGACLLGPGSGSCSADEYCDPARGCLPRPTSIPDGGVPPPVQPTGQVFYRPDLTGDGAADLITRSSDAVYIFEGGSAFAPTGPSDAFATVSASGRCELAGGLYRADIDGDGETDLLIGSRCGTAAGVAILNAPVASGSLDLSSLPHVVLSPEGWAVSRLATADLSGDGVVDLAAAFSEGVARSGINTGIVRVFFGLTSLGDAPAPDVAYEGVGEDRFGTRLAMHPGDLTGDGLPDLVVGAMDADEAAIDSGAAYVFDGPLTPGTHIAPDAAFARCQGRHVSALAGTGTALWDGNLDGMLDLVVGSDEDNGMGNYSGRVFVVFGPIAPGVQSLSVANRTITGTPPDEFGTNLDATADYDGDGERDLLIWACCGRDGDLRTIGNLSGVAARPALGNYDRSTVDFHYRGELDDGRWGEPAGIGDVNGDGIDDFAAAFVLGATGDGQVYVYFGRRGPWPVGPPSATADVILAGTVGAAAAFGSAIAAR